MASAIFSQGSKGSFVVFEKRPELLCVDLYRKAIVDVILDAVSNSSVFV